jgi:hypothetical protein
MTKKFLTPILFLLFSNHSFAQKVFTISGIVSEQVSEETLIGVMDFTPSRWKKVPTP